MLTTIRALHVEREARSVTVTVVGRGSHTAVCCQRGPVPKQLELLRNHSDRGIHQIQFRRCLELRKAVYSPLKL